jgi:hypothetical protein
MASNHSEQTGESDSLALDFLWTKMSTTARAGVTLAQAKKLAKNGLISVSNVLEQAILDTNKKLKKSNKTGEDYTDGSDAKYMTARPRGHGSYQGKKKNTVHKITAAVLSPASVKNKKGSLRVFITHIDEVNDRVEYRMFLLPYPQWKKIMPKGGIDFCFNVKGELAPRSVKRWGKFEVKTFKELCK